MTLDLLYFGNLVSVNHKYTITKGRKLVLNPNFRKMLLNFSSQFLPQLWYQHDILRDVARLEEIPPIIITIQLFRVDSKRYKDIDVDNVVKPTIDTITRLLGIDDSYVVAMHSIRGERVNMEAHLAVHGQSVYPVLNQEASGWVLKHILNNSGKRKNSRRRNGGKKKRKNNDLVLEWVPVLDNLRRKTYPPSLNEFMEKFYLSTFLNNLSGKSRLYMMTVKVEFKVVKPLSLTQSPNEILEILHLFN